MIKVSSVVSDIIHSSPIALEAMRMEILNLNAYADQIQEEVENRCFKSVKKTTIVVALSRMRKNFSQIQPLFPYTKLTELNIQSPLCDVTFERTAKNLELSRTLAHHLGQKHSLFLTVTQGMSEITILISQEDKEKVLTHFAVKPKAIYENLVGLSVKFGEEYLSQPNVIYVILTALAAKRINLIEIVSTFTELTLVVEKNAMESTIRALNTLFVN